MGADINQILSNAQKLMLSEEFNRKVEGIANLQGGGRKHGPSDSELKAMEASIFGFDTSTNTTRPQMIAETNSRTNKQFENPILAESFRQMPPLGAELQNVLNPSSSLDETIDFSGLQQKTRQIQPQPQVMSNAGVDYSIIKAIVNECLKENNKNMLTENVRGVKLGKGNVIQFMDSKGNIYEGVLKLKKKASSN